MEQYLDQVRERKRGKPRRKPGLGLALGLVGALGLASVGCGAGAYSKDWRAGVVVNEIAQGAWNREIAREGGSEVNQNVYNGGHAQGNGVIYANPHDKPAFNARRALGKTGPMEPLDLNRPR